MLVSRLLGVVVGGAAALLVVRRRRRRAQQQRRGQHGERSGDAEVDGPAEVPGGAGLPAAAAGEAQAAPAVASNITITTLADLHEVRSLSGGGGRQGMAGSRDRELQGGNLIVDAETPRVPLGVCTQLAGA